jgi:hypothetical protein
MTLFKPEKMKAVQYGQAIIEGIPISCAVGENLHIYIPVFEICNAIQVPLEDEEKRILENSSLRKGVVMMEFVVIESGQESRHSFLSINLTRLHTWLASIPAERITDASLRSKLETLQDDLADLVYAYFGRPLMPPDLLAEQETSLSEATKNRYATLEELQKTESILADLEGRMNQLEVIISNKDVGDFISRTQREQFRVMTVILGKILEEKGTGDIMHVHRELKDQFKFPSYKVITVEEWPRIVSYCQQWFRRISPPGKPIPSAFRVVEQKKIW